MPDAAQSLLEAFESFATEPALTDQNRTLSFRELWDEAGRIAAGFEQAGCRQGDRLAILLPVCAEYVSLLLACLRTGITACPLSTRLPEEGIRASLRKLEAKTLITKDPPPQAYGIPTLPCRELFASTDTSRPRSPDAAATAKAGTIVFTSGSSGTPKAALLTLANHCASATASNRNIPLQPGNRWLLSLPLFHVAGQGVVFRCLLGGAAIAIPGPGEGLGEAITRYGITHVSLVPTQLYRLLRDDADALRTLKAILLGGSAASDGLIEAAVAQQLPLFRTYGSTETASQVTTTRLEDGAEALFSSGKPLLPDTVRITGDGEIQVRGETLFAGYAHGDAVERPLTPDGWFATRDLGRFDEGGNLVVTGRKDNLFISGGENIRPEEIEAALGAIQGVVQAIVVPVDDEEFGQRPVAFVDMDVALEPQILRERLARSLPGFKIPKVFLPWPDDFRAPGIKPNRADFARLV